MRPAEHEIQENTPDVLIRSINFPLPDLVRSLQRLLSVAKQHEGQGERTEERLEPRLL